MKIPSLISITALILFLFCFTSCQKKINWTLEYGGTKQDSTITDTTQFIDITLNGERIFEISATTADSNSHWNWYPLLFFWGFVFPDTTNYPLTSYKGGLRTSDSLWTPGFYFLKNIYGVNLQPYTAETAWWTPLVKQSFIDSFFQAGNYNYAVSLNKDTVFAFTPFSDPVTRNLLGSGVQLTWVDKDGKIWQTTKGVADQTTSFFSITKNESLPFIARPGYSDYAASTLVSAVFECNLYDDAGNVIHLTNGKFQLMLQFDHNGF